MVDLSEKYNLMEITKDKLEQICENNVGNGVHVALLYCNPVILYNIGKNNNETQVIVSYLSKYNHPFLALNYGFLIDKKSSEYQETDKVYIVRELVKGKNFNNILNYHIHDRLVLIYKLICLLEYIHSFDVFYLFLHPSKIIITDDVEIKVVDHIKMNDDNHTLIKLENLTDEMRFISPELLNPNLKLEKIDREIKKNIDLYSLGCILFYTVTGELPWSKLESKDEILKQWSQGELFLENEEFYSTDIKKVYLIISMLLSSKYTSTETLRQDFEKLSEVEDYNKNGTLMFDFEEESKKVLEDIDELIAEIDKIYEDNNLNKVFNSIQIPNTKLKFSNHQEVDFTKPIKKNNNNTEKEK